MFFFWFISRANGQMPNEIESNDFDDLRFRFNLFSKEKSSSREANRRAKKRRRKHTMDWRRCGRIIWFSFCKEVMVRCISKRHMTKPVINCHHWYCRVPLALVLRFSNWVYVYFSVYFTHRLAHRIFANDGAYICCGSRWRSPTHSFRTQLNLSQSMI